jgi:hypothetical protein
LVLGEATSQLLIACDGTCRAVVDLNHLFVVVAESCCDQGGALKPFCVSWWEFRLMFSIFFQRYLISVR